MNAVRPPGQKTENADQLAGGSAPEISETQPEKDSAPLSDDQAIWREHTLIYRQPKIAVYWNGYDHVVIRQEPLFDPREDDVVITVDPKHLPALIERLKEMLEEVTP